MGTISDKLMRIINTKEDIRQALISKGYDVPTSIPFKEYAKMILDLPCNADSFPDIEGIVARYSASGLTNEQMAANPVWVDKTGNGHDLQLKNFSWKGMSGVGGYGDEKVLDWYKKQYPWLFPDQAWTVTGKTNEDEDRATIANITGNGNDLVLSNFAFSENSGYGEYAYNFSDTSWISIPDYGVISDKTSKSFNIKSFVLADYPVLYTAVNKDSSIKKVKIKVTNSIPGFYFGNKPANQIIDLSTDGIYEIPSYNSPNDVTQYGFRCSNVNDSCNITIEQIPEYEGYLVTDGVDDKAVSKQFKFGENFTVILDFKFPVKKISYCGFDLSSKVRIQNLQGSGVYVVLKGNKTLIPSNVVRAVTSEGKVYDENWNEYNIVPGNISSNYTMVNLGFDGSNQFAESATKLAGIYSSILSKDECIKAYNYLQTLKSK